MDALKKMTWALSSFPSSRVHNLARLLQVLDPVLVSTSRWIWFLVRSGSCMIIVVSVVPLSGSRSVFVSISIVSGLWIASIVWSWPRPIGHIVCIRSWSRGSSWRGWWLFLFVWVHWFLWIWRSIWVHWLYGFVGTYGVEGTEPKLVSIWQWVSKSSGADL